MNDAQLLIAQTRHVYNWLSSATGDVDFEAARGTFGQRPSIAWLVGHMLVNADSTAEAVAGQARTIEELGDEPHWGCTTEADWTHLVATWKKQSALYLAALEDLDPGVLELPPHVPVLSDFKNTLKDRRRFWSGHVFHMAYHLGQLGSLRAELGLGWWKP